MKKKTSPTGGAALPAEGRRQVLVTDPINPQGLEALKNHPGIDLRLEVGPTPEKLRECVGGAWAWLVRSETKITRDWIEKAGSLKIIGRAGVGVDNIDIKAATLKGIAVVNAPSANTIAACEHAIGLMLALSRKIAQADADSKAGNWQRKKWLGTELHGKTLGIVGLGRIGREVAKRAAVFGMKIVAHDPFVSAEQAETLGVRLADLKTVLSEGDFVTLHAPGLDKTRHLINPESLGWMKKGARLVNCARGELVDEAALVEALRDGRLAGAALDVFAKEPLPAESPLRSLDNVILTPHLGASTTEAQGRVASELADKIVEFYETGIPLGALNLAGFDALILDSLGGFLGLAESLGRFAGQLIEGGVREITTTFHGDFSPAQRRPLAVSVLKGCLSVFVDVSINAVNAQALAAERGIKTSESVAPPAAEGYQRLLTVAVETEKGPVSVSGTLAADREPRIVRLGRMGIDFRPQGRMLVLTNNDKPGMIGAVGRLLGGRGINIADMRVGRQRGQGEAVMVISVDEDVEAGVLKKLGALPGIRSVRLVTL